MSLATLIRAMSDAGAPPEAIALAVEAIEAADAKIEAVRASARERKRRQRAGQSRDGHGTVTPTPPETKVSPTPPTKTQTPTPPYSPPAPRAALPEKPLSIPLSDAVQAIFELQPRGYRRSSRPDILDALTVQAKEGASLGEIHSAVKAYYALPASREDEGKFAKAAHRIIQRGRWKDYAPKPEQTAPPATIDEIIRRERHHRDTGEWREAWGPKPQRDAEMQRAIQ